MCSFRSKLKWRKKNIFGWFGKQEGYIIYNHPGNHSCNQIHYSLSQHVVLGNNMEEKS